MTSYICLVICLFAISIAQAVVPISDYFLVHNNPKVGRIHNQDNDPFCTATLIGRACAVTAAHCADSEMETVQFNIPIKGKFAEAKSMDTYQVDQRSIVAGYDFHQRIDWTVFRLKQHKAKRGIGKLWHNIFVRDDLSKYPEEGYFPGDIQGFYQVSFDPITPGTTILIHGYGKNEDPKYDTAQKRRMGLITSMLEKDERKSNYSIYHNIVTTPGDSGSAIIDAKTQKLIGIHHTNFIYKKTNASAGGEGISIHHNKSLKRAIMECLEYEKNYL